MGRRTPSGQHLRLEDPCHRHGATVSSLDVNNAVQEAGKLVNDSHFPKLCQVTQRVGNNAMGKQATRRINPPPGHPSVCLLIHEVLLATTRRPTVVYKRSVCNPSPLRNEHDDDNPGFS